MAKKYGPDTAALNRLTAQLTAIGLQESGEAMAGTPVRWADNPHWRCAAAHVTTSRPEWPAGTHQCDICGSDTVLTFPEDRGGPLAHRYWVPASSPKVQPAPIPGQRSTSRPARARLRQMRVSGL